MIKERDRFRSIRKGLATFILLLLIFPGQLDGQAADEVASVTITVSNIEESISFFTDVLDFRMSSEIMEIYGNELNNLFGIDKEGLKIKEVKLALGTEKIELIQFIEPATGRAIPADSKSNDLWFQHIAIVTSNMDSAYAQLRRHKVVFVSSSPQTLPDYIPAAAGIKAFYFRDPDGHNLEVIDFPEDKGNPKWQDSEKGIFLGIDHTAIGISDTESSTSFYRDLIGLTVAGVSENFGTEQEHLNQVFGAHLVITGLKAPKGFGVEFLDYLAPPGGRKYYADSEPYDLWHWHTTIRLSGIQILYDKLKNLDYPIVSNGITDIGNLVTGGDKGFLVRDPDGHAILITE
ncbi:MAG: VOC family protein [Bacteroidales bacterium]|nr:VOC family protein [Bacteroidales bacterium]MDT8374243.1 VOC family protein [Bacteroidales bacterium]